MIHYKKVLDKIKSFLFRNRTEGQTVAKNVVWLSISNFGGRLLKAAIVIYGARALGTSEWGVFSYVATLAGFLTYLMDPGVNAILMRDASKVDEERRRAIFSTTFVIKTIFLAAGIGIVLFIAPHFSILPGAKALLPIVACILIFDTSREFFSSLIRAKEKMELEAAIFLLTNASVVVFSYLLLVHAPTAQSFGWGYAAGTAVGAAAAAVILRPYLDNMFSYFSRALVLPILRSAWPFAISGVLGLLLTNTDILIISWMRPASDVGIYSATIRIIQILYIIPSILQYSTLPLFARLARRDDARLRGAFERTMGMAFMISVPIALGGIVLGTKLMAFIFGAAYVPGGLPLRVLMITLPFDFPLAIISGALFAYDAQRVLVRSSAIGAIVNTVMDLLLIPPFGITGSAFATLIAQALSNWYLWRSMNNVNRFRIFPLIKKIALAGALMAALVLLLSTSGMHVALVIVLGAIFYAGTLYVLKEPLLTEMKRLMRPASETIESAA